MNSVKDRIIVGIGLDVVERPRALQQAAGTDEHHVVHELYSLQRQGLTTFTRRRNMHRPGLNLTKIRLTPRGVERYRELTNG